MSTTIYYKTYNYLCLQQLYIKPVNIYVYNNLLETG